MMTLKFQPLREQRQECYNIEDYALNEFDFEGKVKKVYSNVNLSIFTDDYCNADCNFCVAQLRCENKGQKYLKFRIVNDEKYLLRLEYVLNELKPLNPSISITGGEPTKSRRLPAILDIVKRSGYRKRTLTTNGSGLLDSMDGKPIIQHIADNGFSHLNISKAHYNEEINKRIMQYKEGSGYCSNEIIETVVAYSKSYSLRPRMSCLLLKEGISNLSDIINYIEYYRGIGLDNVIFRELMDYGCDMSNLKKTKYCTENKVKLNDIWKEIDKNPDFEPIKNLLGYYYYVEVYKYKGVDMCSEGANLVKLYEEKEKHKDIVYELVFHPNGNLNGSWVDSEDILMEYK
jgi:GTP 3',8-cyclase